MDTDYSDIPTSFDPAIYLDSEPQLPPENAPASVSHSDDLEALHQFAEEERAKNKQLRVVIQHRSSRYTDIYRSEDEPSIDTPSKPLRRPLAQRLARAISSNSESFPSSPPSLAMPLTSSPLVYPPSSVPRGTTPNKRKRSVTGREPLKDVLPNHGKRRVGGFLDDSEDEDEEDASEALPLKRRAVNVVAELHNGVENVDTPPASQGENADIDLPDHLDYAPSSPTTTLRAAPFEHVPSSTQRVRGGVAKSASGKEFYIGAKRSRALVAYEELIAARSLPVEGRARTSYYGVDIHSLIDEAKVMDQEQATAREKMIDYPVQMSIEPCTGHGKSIKSQRTLMWTEKYRAKKFTDLVGDERTHRSVLRWLKAWDPIVFPGSTKAKPKKSWKEDDNGEFRHRKVLLLTGPPGLGKTTLAHVCAKQAGYEVQEINASDERSSHVVKGRIRDMVGTENVRGINTKTANGKVRKAGKPVCVVVDEVDGVVSGSGGAGEGGFIKALIDLISLDERNSRFAGTQTSTTTKKKRGDKFRLLRPLILVCNDVYHPSLRPLRQSSYAEVIHMRKPALNMVVSRIHDIFTREGILADSDAVRRIYEETWGVSTKKEGGTGSGAGEGDIRGVMVVSEWVAGRLRASKEHSTEDVRLTRRWVEDTIINDLSHGGGAARSLGRGGTKEVVDRVFREGAGFPKQSEAATKRKGIQGVIGVAESSKRRAMDRLREMVNTSGDVDRIVTDCFTAFPEKPYQDDSFLSKPTAAYEWLAFHDMISSQVHSSQEWELAPYLPQSVLAFHDLFASPRQQSSNPTTEPDAQPAPFTGPGAAYAASEATKAARAQLMGLQTTLSLPLTRQFRSPEELAKELLPYGLRMLSPDVKPVIVNTGAAGSKSIATASVRKASEKALVKKAVEAMAALGVRFERSRIEVEDIANRGGGWILRMEPPLDQLATLETLGGKKDEKVRYAVRSVLETEWKKESLRMDADARKRRGGHVEGDVEGAPHNPAEGALKNGNEKVEKDFFGRVVKQKPVVEGAPPVERKKAVKSGDEGRIWVSFHEGFSNAVRKPITIDDLMRGL